MLKIKMITVGKIKEKTAAGLIAEYEKRIGAYASFEAAITEDAPPPKNPSAAECEKALSKEKEKIMKEINPRAFKIALCVEGKKLSSEEFASLLSSVSMSCSEIDFIVGGSNGLHGDIKALADLKLSMSCMTFPHNLARLMATEQIYRAFTIIANTSYHK